MQAQGGGEGSAGSVYRGLRSRRGSPMLGEINVTPLVDVVLVLLLVFMVTAPMMSRGIDVSLPVADQPQIAQEDRITVSVRSDGTRLRGRPAGEHRAARGPAAGPDLGDGPRASSTCGPTRACATAR